MVEKLLFMTMVSSYVTDGVLQTCATWTPHGSSQSATSGIRQDNELILERHPRPFALPIDEMDAWF